MKKQRNQLMYDFRQALPSLFPQLQLKEIRTTEEGGRVKVNVQGNTYLLQLIACFYPYPSQMKEMMKQLQKKAGNVVLLAFYFPPRSQVFLQEQDVNFLDLSGNASLSLSVKTGNNKHTVHLSVNGRPNRFAESETLKNIFQGKSSRIVRFLLESFPKRTTPLEISRRCNVSPALVTKVIRSLEQKGDVFKERGKGKEIEVIEPGLLLDRWADRYRFQNHFLERRILVNMPIQEVLKSMRSKKDIAVTGTAAASLIAPFANFNVMDVYKVSDTYTFPGTEVDRGENVRIWAPADDGVLDFVQEVDGIQTVGLIQLYLDLSSDPKRGKEQADFLRKEKLEF